MSGSEKRKIKKILELIKAGEAKGGYELLKEVLVENPENVTAWEILLKIADNEKERNFARFRIDQLKQSAKTPSPEASKQPASNQSKPGAPSQAPPPSAAEVAGGEVREAIALMKAGKERKARRIVKSVLKKDPAFPQALYASGLLATSRKEYTEALKGLAAVGTKDPSAKPYYQKLAARRYKEKRKSRMPIYIMAGGGSLFVILIGFIIGTLVIGDGNEAGVLDDVADNSEEMTCEELIANAMQVSDQSCKGIGSNEVCYGNDHLDSVFSGDPEDFDLVGDILGIESLKTLSASPLDLAKQLWGVAVFKLKANMPGTVPGQNVTFLAFGNTDIDNDSGDMTAFYFSTGIGGVTCNGVDFDGLKIDMENGAGIEFMANEVQIALEGNAIMVAQPGGEMDVTVVSGEATVTADGVTRSLYPGSYVSIPMTEEMGAAGAPSEVEKVTGDQASLLCQMYGSNCPNGETSFVLGSDPEATEMAAVTETFTQTVTGTATETPTPTITNTPTITPEGFVASSTPIPSKTLVPSTATNTTVPPTNTPIPPPATNTPVPPTPTNTSVPTSCSQISVSFTGLGTFQISNNGSGPIVLVSMEYDWPVANGKWDDTKLGGSNIPAPQKLPPVIFAFKGDLTARTFGAGISKEMVTGFKDDLVAGTYSAMFNFDNGCGKAAGN